MGTWGLQFADRRPWDLSVSVTVSQFLVMNLYIRTHPIRALWRTLTQKLSPYQR